MQTRTTLAESIAERNEISKKLARKIVDDVFAIIANEISTSGGEVRISEFGIFSAKLRAEKGGVNPHTGEKMTIPAKTVPYFKASSVLKTAVDVSAKTAKGSKKKSKK